MLYHNKFQDTAEIKTSKPNGSILTMPRFVPNIFLSDCWSSVGDVTFYHANGNCYYRKRAKPNFPNTENQQVQSSIHRRALQAWKSLSHDIQLKWNKYAIDVPSHRPPYDHDNHISGFNLFVSAYHGFALLKNEHIPEPVPYPQFPLYNIRYEGYQIIDDIDLKVIFSIEVHNDQDCRRFFVLGKIMLAPLGVGCKTGKLRNFVSVYEETPGEETHKVSFLIPNYKESFGLNSSDCQLHMRYLLVDSKTGYRNFQKRISIAIQ